MRFNAQELAGYRKNLARGRQSDPKRLSGKNGGLVDKGLERRMKKLEKRMAAVEGRNNSMWRRFIEGGFFTGT